jgi:polysaccharide biosynthesis/export protein
MKCFPKKLIGSRLAGISAASLLLGMVCASVAQQPPPPTAAMPSAAKPAAAGGAADSASYVIGPEDGLEVTVWKEPTLSGKFPVRPDGMISLSLLGDVQAAGLTPMQLGDRITQMLKKFIQDPSVSVVVSAVNSQKIYIVGEVAHVGPIALAAGMTPLQAISSAGGLTMFANPKRIYILRNDQGKQQKIPFDYKQALKGDSKQLVPLHPGDTIVVP